ncbi:MAG: hypothetical protein K2H72_01120 [Muribaculaceae bacterium]|nr:hypothetical protein [Muribaculaceae bacterium]
MRLLLFNPETEYALASGASFYTPPARVEQMRRERELLPEAWANPEDVILVDDPAAMSSSMRLASWNDLAALFAEIPDLTVEPWGWNPALLRRLLDAGVPPRCLPDKLTIERIRNLAHRRTTIQLNNRWNDYVANGHIHRGNDLTVDIPVELDSIEVCMEYYRSNPHCWMKAPWSSSGRGVINTAADMTEILVEQWCRGILRRQGSVMGETGADRIADFATEWRISSGMAEFLGLSSFSTSNRGKYISNYAVTQEEMRSRFNSLSVIPADDLISIQKLILEESLSDYDGLCGVDILIERRGHIRPFVELNLRRTMGMLHLRPVP